LQLLALLLFGHLIADAVGVPESPHRKLVENAKLQKDVEIQKLQGLFFVSKGVRDVRRFRIVLAASIFIEIVESANQPGVISDILHQKAQRQKHT